MVMELSIIYKLIVGLYFIYFLLKGDSLGIFNFENSFLANWLF